jgi:hypothetical protein
MTQRDEQLRAAVDDLRGFRELLVKLYARAAEFPGDFDAGMAAERALPNAEREMRDAVRKHLPALLDAAEREIARQPATDDDDTLSLGNAMARIEDWLNDPAGETIRPDDVREVLDAAGALLGGDR